MKIYLKPDVPVACQMQTSTFPNVIQGSEETGSHVGKEILLVIRR